MGSSCTSFGCGHDDFGEGRKTSLLSALLLAGPRKAFPHLWRQTRQKCEPGSRELFPVAQEAAFVIISRKWTTSRVTGLQEAAAMTLRILRVTEGRNTATISKSK